MGHSSEKAGYAKVHCALQHYKATEAQRVKAVT